MDQDTAHDGLAQGLKLGATLQTGIEICRRDNGVPVALIYGQASSKDTRALVRAFACLMDLIYVLSRAYAFSGLTQTDEGRKLKRLIGDALKSATGRRVA